MFRQASTNNELGTETKRLPHLEVGHGSVTVLVLSVEGLKNSGRLGFPDRVTSSSDDNSNNTEDEILLAVLRSLSFIERHMIEVKEDENVVGDLSKEGKKTHDRTGHPFLFNTLTKDERD